MKDSKQNHNKSILLAESFAPARKILSDIFNMLGYNFTVAENGYEVILELKNKDVDLILLDIELSQYDGFETIEHIRRNLDYPKNTTPVIVMTNKDFPSDFKETYKNEGFDDIIIKPFSLDELEDKINNLLFQSSKKGKRIVT